MSRLLLVVLVLCACSKSTTTEPRTIDHISAVIADRSFIAAHGRLPDEADDTNERIRTHLLYVAGMLRASSSAALSPNQQQARGRVLDHLERYANARVFPAGEAASGFLPTFVDDEERRCAVAYLLEQTDGMDKVREINARYRNAFIADMKSETLVAWAADNGLRMQEVALIQPAYPPARSDLRHRILLRNESQVGGAETTTDHLSGVEAQLEWRQQHSINPLRLGIDAFVGAANADELAYRFHAWMGWSFGFQVYDSVINGERRNHWAAGPHVMGLRLGAGVEEAGGDIGRAVTLPLEGFYSYPTSKETRLSLHLGPVLSLAGDERPHGFQTALEFRWKRIASFFGLERWDVHLGVGYQRRASADFVALQLGVGKFRHDGWYIRE